MIHQYQQGEQHETTSYLFIYLLGCSSILLVCTQGGSFMMQKTQHKEEKKRNEGKKESCNFPFRIGNKKGVGGGGVLFFGLLALWRNKIVGAKRVF